MDILRKKLLILASAGSGKTFQLANRIIGLVANGAEPAKIVALTFTRKAAGEFADSLLNKLADAADNPAKAENLSNQIKLENPDFQDVLQRVVRSLPKLTLGTIDGFFARVVRGFQYELGLTGGTFQMIEGPQAEALADQLLAEILGQATATDSPNGFLHAFRRANAGRENHNVTAALRQHVEKWQAVFQECRDLEWGAGHLLTHAPDDWEKEKHTLAATALKHLDQIDYTQAKQRDALEAAILELEEHTIGGGSLGNPSSLLQKILDARATPGGKLDVKFYKDFTIAGPTASALCDMISLAAACELSAAILRTRAIHDVVAYFDEACELKLRRNGLLGFNDIKLLMGRWAFGENDRIRRELVDFRLDATIDHWLLDEFQDTSRADWGGLLPLVGEVASDPERTIFIVGDRKQAIYAWRGGDVSLFDDMATLFGEDLKTETMAESWRSCPEVLSLVNLVCGDTTTLGELFGPVARRWPWEQHDSAPPLTSPDRKGESRVEMTGSWEERLERLPVLLREIGVGTRAMTCGILLRGNEKAAQVADHLRAEGFDVIEEGRRKPASDNPVGITILHLLKWLANPEDVYSRQVVTMSPLLPVLKDMHGESWGEIWNSITAEISKQGFARTISSILSEASTGWSNFGKRRAGDLISALSSLDLLGESSAERAAHWLENLEISQNPGTAAVQVMTIHKSKGLGFDVVVLPEIPDEVIPQTQHFQIAKTDKWLLETPPKWVRNLTPELCEAETAWGETQRYEAFCMLYVAMTRAKRGLYILLEPAAKTADPDKPSLANWLSRAIGADSGTGFVYQNGDANWSANLPLLNKTEEAPAFAGPLPGAQTEKKASPAHSAQPSSRKGADFGIRMHQWLETVTWLDEAPPAMDPAIAPQATSFLQQPEISRLLHKNGRNIQLYREQPVDSWIDGSLVSGVIDRMHLHRDGSGTVSRIEILDFKTDRVQSGDELVLRHQEQLDRYKTALSKIHPQAAIDCYLLSTHLGQALKI